MSNRTGRTAGIVLLSVIMLSCSGNEDNQKSKMSNNGKKPDNRVPVNVYIVKSEKLNNRINTSGTIIANEEVELRSEISGKLTKIYFTEGSGVTKNQLLAKINDSELQSQLTKAVLQRKLAEEKELRQRQLKDKNAISQQEYDIALNELNTLKSEEELIKARIEKTEIRAPFEGFIGLKYVSEGSFISSSNIIATLVDVSPLKIDFSIPERYAHLVKKGLKISFSVQGVSNNLEGVVYAAEPRINSVSRTVQIRALYPNNDRKILPGAFADIELMLDETIKGISVPSESIIPELNGQKVFILKNEKVQSVPVEAGIRSTNSLQITKGLSFGDTVITSGLLQIKPGSSVRVMNVL